jgi:DNA-binding MarR family transcriptional regulator
LLDAMDREGRRLGFHSTMHSHACAAFTGLHPTDWEVLDVLCWKGTLSAGEIAGHLGLSNGAVTGAIDRLERDGWVRRRRDDHDRRRVIVDLLKDRDAEVDEIFGALSSAISDANAQFSDDELDVVVRYLRTASVALEESTHQVRASTRARGWASSST